MSYENWTSGEPKEPGFYWYYGNVHDQTSDDKKRFCLLKVHKNISFMDGAFLFDFRPREGGFNGKFMRIEMPEIPELDE